MTHLRLVTDDNPWIDPRSYRPDPAELLREHIREREATKRRRQTAVTWFCLVVASWAVAWFVGTLIVRAL